MAELRAMVAFIEETGLFPPEDADPAGDHLYEHTNGRDWVVSQEADSLLTEFERHLVKKGRESDFTKAQKPLQKDPHSHYQPIRDWVQASCSTEMAPTNISKWRGWFSAVISINRPW